MFKGGQYVKEEYLNSEYTKDEMTEIGNALERYQSSQQKYPSDFKTFVMSKPIWSSWLNDQWESKYNYSLSSDGGFKLTSAGPDRIMNSSDDIVITDK